MHLERHLSPMLCAIAVLITLGCAPSSDDSMKFEADAYRPQIEAIEQHIAAEPTATHGSRLGVLITDLAGELGNNINNQRFRETIQVRLVTFGDIFAMAEQQGVPFDPAQAQELWLQTRADLFKDADWFTQ